jgi:hypothetical protein
MKLCKDCKHIRLGCQSWQDRLMYRLLCLPVNSPYIFAKCAIPVSTNTDPVSGEVDTKYYYCETQRKYDGDSSCGPEGKNWEAKE